jgi:hypothetical protein
LSIAVLALIGSNVFIDVAIGAGRQTDCNQGQQQQAIQVRTSSHFILQNFFGV